MDPTAQTLPSVGICRVQASVWTWVTEQEAWPEQGRGRIVTVRQPKSMTPPHPLIRSEAPTYPTPSSWECWQLTVLPWDLSRDSPRPRPLKGSLYPVSDLAPLSQLGSTLKGQPASELPSRIGEAFAAAASGFSISLCPLLYPLFPQRCWFSEHFSVKFLLVASPFSWLPGGPTCT